MRTLSRSIASIVLTLAVAAGVTIAPASPALAAPCSGQSCFGRNPEGLCSADVQPLLGRDYNVGGQASFRIEIRYSPSCRAGWMRMIRFPGTGNQSYQGFAWNLNGPSTGWAGHNGTVTWTEMVDGSPGKYICGGLNLSINGVDRGWYDPGCVAR